MKPFAKRSEHRDAWQFRPIHNQHHCCAQRGRHCGQQAGLLNERAHAVAVFKEVADAMLERLGNAVPLALVESQRNLGLVHPCAREEVLLHQLYIRDYEREHDRSDKSNDD